MAESRLMNKIKDEALRFQRKMKPQARLEAFVTHSRLMAELFRAGAKYRTPK